MTPDERRRLADLELFAWTLEGQVVALRNAMHAAQGARAPAERAAAFREAMTAARAALEARPVPEARIAAFLRGATLAADATAAALEGRDPGPALPLW